MSILERIMKIDNEKLLEECFNELQGHLDSCLSSINEEDEPQAYKYIEEMIEFVDLILGEDGE